MQSNPGFTRILPERAVCMKTNVSIFWHTFNADTLLVLTMDELFVSIQWESLQRTVQNRGCWWLTDNQKNINTQRVKSLSYMTKTTATRKRCLPTAEKITSIRASSGMGWCRNYPTVRGDGETFCVHYEPTKVLQDQCVWPTSHSHKRLCCAARVWTDMWRCFWSDSQEILNRLSEISLEEILHHATSSAVCSYYCSISFCLSIIYFSTMGCFYLNFPSIIFS